MLDDLGITAWLWKMAVTYLPVIGAAGTNPEQSVLPSTNKDDRIYHPYL